MTVVRVLAQGRPNRSTRDVGRQCRVGEGDHVVDDLREGLGEFGGVWSEAASVGGIGVGTDTAVVADDLSERPKGDITMPGGRGQSSEQVPRGDVVAAGEGPDVGVVAYPAVAGAELDGGAEPLRQDDR
jgi:hypothetical protein